MQKRQWLLGASLLLASNLLAEEQTEVVVTANRYENNIDQVGSSISVIDSEEIEARNTKTILELLRTEPGVTVTQTGGRGRTASVFLRGGNSSQTLVLIDGLRINDSNTGLVDFADLTTENIDRIEILRGPQSVLYGSEAIGGVIQIITKRAAKGLASSLSAAGGSNSTQDYIATLAYGNEHIDSSTSVAYYRTDGESAASDRIANEDGVQNSEDDSYENVNISSRLGANFLEDGRADLTFGFTQGETEVDGFSFGIGATDDPNFEQERDSFRTTLALSKPVAEGVTPKIELGYLDETLEGIDPDTDFNNFEIDNQIFSLRPKMDFSLHEAVVVSVGYDYERQEGKNKNNFEDKRDVNSFYLQNQFSTDEWLFITAGIRHDNDSDFGDETTYRVTAAAIPGEYGTRVHTSYGTGFRAPSFNELSFPFFGNPELDAETSWGFDFGVEQAFLDEDIVVDLTYFQNQFDNLIAFDSTTFLAENIQAAEVWGFETTVDLAICEWADAQVSYTYTDSEDKATGEALARRARHIGAANIFLKPLEKLTATVTFLYVNDRRDSDGSVMDNYERVDLAVDYLLDEHVKPFIRIDNLFDQDYEEVPTFSSPGFEIFAGVKVLS